MLIQWSWISPCDNSLKSSSEFYCGIISINCVKVAGASNSNGKGGRQAAPVDVGSPLLDWEEGDHFSFEDSERFEEDSLCSWSSEPESLCNNWRGWRKPNLQNSFGPRITKKSTQGNSLQLILCFIFVISLQDYLPYFANKAIKNRRFMSWFVYLWMCRVYISSYALISYTYIYSMLICVYVLVGTKNRCSKSFTFSARTVNNTLLSNPSHLQKPFLCCGAFGFLNVFYLWLTNDWKVFKYELSLLSLIFSFWLSWLNFIIIVLIISCWLQYTCTMITFTLVLSHINCINLKASSILIIIYSKYYISTNSSILRT